MRPEEARALLRALRRELAALRARLGRGASQYLAGGAVLPLACFADGTWADEANPETPEYAFAQTSFHGQPGIRQDWTGGAPGGGRREAYLRLARALLLPAGRDATFCLFLQGIRSNDPLDKPPNRLDLLLGLVTAPLSQATLEAMTWANKPASDAGHLLGRYYEKSTTGSPTERPEGSWGQDDFWLGAPGTPPGAGDDCLAATVRVRPVAAVTLTGVRLWIAPGEDEYTDADGAAWILRTRPGDPHRSFILLE